MLFVDRENNRGANLFLCETEDDLRQIDAALNETTPAAGWGARTSVEMYEVMLDEVPAARATPSGCGYASVMDSARTARASKFARRTSDATDPLSASRKRRQEEMAGRSARLLLRSSTRRQATRSRGEAKFALPTHTADVTNHARCTRSELLEPACKRARGATADKTLAARPERACVARPCRRSHPGRRRSARPGRNRPALRDRPRAFGLGSGGADGSRRR
jgi:hypothetical protein